MTNITQEAMIEQYAHIRTNVTLTKQRLKSPGQGTFLLAVIQVFQKFLNVKMIDDAHIDIQIWLSDQFLELFEDICRHFKGEKGWDPKEVKAAKEAHKTFQKRLIFAKAWEKGVPPPKGYLESFTQVNKRIREGLCQMEQEVAH